MSEEDRAFGQPHRGHPTTEELQEQRELPLPVPRRRVVLDDDMQVLQLRVHTAVADALKGKTDKEIEGALAQGAVDLKIDPEGFIGYTPWKHVEAPPSSGYWEVKQRSARSPDPVRWWYDAPNMMWRTPAAARPGFIVDLHMTAFRNSHEWRGLATPWLRGYAYTLTRLGDDGPAIVPPAAVLDLNPRKGQPGLTAIPVTRRRVEL